MAESQKGVSSSSDAKEKNSSLDVDIGKDFLSSWKSMSMSEDDAMDFDFLPASKDKKKSFNFGKVDMDFNLDGDFAKISSFNMDMSDLGISSPLKKNGKATEKSNGDSTDGANKAKTDRFAFAFDFDELGGFCFEPNLSKNNRNAQQDKGSEGSSKKVGCEDEEGNRETTLVEDGKMFKGKFSKEPKASGKEITSHAQVDMENSSEDSASGTNKVKTDRIAFAFDFDEVGSFRFESNSSKDSPNVQQDKACEGSSKKTACEEEEGYLETTLVEDGKILKGKFSQEPSVSGNQTSSCVQLDKISELDPAYEKSPSELETSASSDVIDDLKMNKARASLQKKVPSSNEEKNSQLEMTTSAAPINQEACIVNIAKQDVSAHSVHDDEQSQNIALESEEVNSMAMETNKSSPGENTNVKPIDTCFPQSASISKENSEEGSLVGRETHVSMSKKKSTEQVGDDSLEYSSATIVREESLKTENARESQKPTSEIHQAPLRRSANDMIQDREREPIITRSRFFVQSNKSDTCSLKAPSSQPIGPPFNKLGSSRPSCVDERRDADTKVARNDGKLSSSSLKYSFAPKGKECLQNVRQQSCMALKINGEGFDSGDVQNGRKLLNPSKTKDEYVMKEKSASSESEMKLKDLDMIGSHISRSGSSIQTRSDSANSTSSASDIASDQDVRNTTAGKEKLSPIKASKNAADFSTLKISRTFGSNIDAPKSLSQNNDKSVRSVGQNKFTLGNTSSTSDHLIGPQNERLSIQPLKRKMLAVSDAEMMVLSPLKRLSQSPRESRNLALASERAVDKKVSDGENLTNGKTKSMPTNSQIATLDAPLDVNMKELVSVENDSNIEMAEACSKELENICNMLRKKHEEAKELLVRSVVNNNKLLMLNHPIYQEKIQMVQRFAASLTLKEPHA